MIGAAVYELQAENAASLKVINGRLMHAAFFKILNEHSPALGNFIHNELNIKPFTVSFLEPIDEIPSSEDFWHVRRGNKFSWRVTGLNAEVSQVLPNIAGGTKIQAGALILTVKKIRVELMTATSDFISETKNLPPAKEICFDFVSPVSFRIDNFDAPYPRAELIFASLADKWSQAAMPAAADKKIIRELAAQIRLTEWDGHSKKFYFGHDRGTLAFWGKFFFDIGTLSADVRKVFVLLAKFAELAGVGRLTGQGFGQTRVYCR